MLITEVFPWIILGVTPLKTNIAMEHPPFEDVFPVENGDVPMSIVSFHGFFVRLSFNFIILRVKHRNRHHNPPCRTRTFRHFWMLQLLRLLHLPVG